ncbi:MAG: nucleoside triphosphate pyrophosphohydrolase [Spirochaetaceae bacterium]|nr:MAG: nucleoside triphosphate pyrophosphohydrolase [Spirochaetaceae bacterium]
MHDANAESTAKGFARLYTIIRMLYGPGGCPWDREQTPKSMREHLVEECYEVLNAIDEDNPTAIQEELGDTLLVLTMIAHMYESAQENGQVSLSGVLSGICEKLIRRHPHVFRDADSQSSGSVEGELDSAGVLSQWDAIKQQEKSHAKRTYSSKDKETGSASSNYSNLPVSVLDSITIGLTPLERAVKLQKRASKIGFDWPKIAPVFEKVHEELNELSEAIMSQDILSIEDEIGDVLFSVINLARKLNTHPTIALHSANKKFETRFRRIEELMHQDGKHGVQLELDLLDSYWEKAKNNP